VHARRLEHRCHLRRRLGRSMACVGARLEGSCVRGRSTQLHSRGVVAIRAQPAVSADLSQPAQRVTLGTVRRLVTLILALLLCVGCSSEGPQSTVARPSPTSIAVSSTLDGVTTLPHGIQWIATPGIPVADVAEVDFLIDGALAWVEYKSPYVYGDDGNWLVTSFF